MNFDLLINTITQTHTIFFQQSVKAVNVNLTLRNWLIGLYIVEFEQNGEDRAKYGDGLLSGIASGITIKGLSETNLKICRQFYNTYPQIHELLKPESGLKLPDGIRQFLPNQLKRDENEGITIRQSATDEFHIATSKEITIRQSATDETKLKKDSYIIKLIQSISFTHFSELIKIDDSMKRKFYELLLLKTTPSVKELKRQIETLAYERIGLSGDKTLALSQLENNISPAIPSDAFKSHYFFEFLNIKYPQLVEETELEQALINHLQNFIIELGNGFCFEARQKRILIGNEYFFIDLVFYHRILKCHLLIDLKAEKAKHEHIGQLKTYLQYYKKNVMTEDDNPPVGLLLVTDQNKALVEYAVAESDKEFFVSKYLIQLPDKEKLARFIENELNELKDF